jgi:hypothetical protein
VHPLEHLACGHVDLLGQDADAGDIERAPAHGMRPPVRRPQHCAVQRIARTAQSNTIFANLHGLPVDTRLDQDGISRMGVIDRLLNGLPGRYHDN